MLVRGRIFRFLFVVKILFKKTNNPQITPNFKFFYSFKFFDFINEGKNAKKKYFIFELDTQKKKEIIRCN